MKILCAVHDYSPEARALLESFGEVTYAQLSQEELVARIPAYDVLFVRIGLEVNAEVLEAGVKLKAIATATTGLNHIDLETAKARGVVILSLRGEEVFLDTITSTAELAFGMLIDLMRYTPWAFESIKKYELDLEEFRGSSLYGKTLGILGMGRLGKIIAEGAHAWRMNVIFCDPNVEQEKFPAYKKVDFDTLLAESDAVTIHVHLGAETAGMFGKEVFAKMKPSAYLINTSRGEILDEEALVEALKEKVIAGYATDVLSRELELLQDFSNHPLVEYAKEHRNCLIVPHTGGLTSDSRIGTDVFMAKKVGTYIRDYAKI